MISYNNALDCIRKTARKCNLGTEPVRLSDAVGRIAAENLIAAIDIQPFDNAAMDGFAVQLKDIENATAEAPVTLLKSGTVGAGDHKMDSVLETGSCYHVMTGALLPKGTEAIVPIEDVIVNDHQVMFRSSTTAGKHIRFAAEDFKKGMVLPIAGEVLLPAHILPLATLGISTVSVYKKPRILFIPTGAELTEDLSAPLAMGQIYNSNAYFACAFLKSCGADVTQHPIIMDDISAFALAIEHAQAENYDIVISSGAVSAGAYDFIAEGLRSKNANILYHKVKLKPGKPNLFALLPNGALYFGLPGNPVATAAGLRFFVTAALRVLQGQSIEKPIYARAMNKFVKKAGLHTILKSHFETWEDGSLSVDILDGQESFMVSPFLKMNSWFHMPEETTIVKAGDVLELYPFSPMGLVSA
jgi:molybdopterin molybdotransferase